MTNTTERVNDQAAVAKGIAGGYALAAGGAGATTVGSELQRDAQEMIDFRHEVAEAVGATPGSDTGLNFVDILGAMPDLRSFGLGLSVLAGAELYRVAERIRKGSETPNQPAALRFVRKAGALALAGVAAYGAYRLSGSLDLDPVATAAAGAGIAGGGVVYAHVTKNRASR